MTAAPDFDARAHAVSGTAPSAASERSFRVTVGHGRFRLRPAEGPGTVLDVDLDRLRCQPLGRAGAVQVRVGQQPVLVDFTDRSTPGLPARVVHGVRARLARRAFLAAVGDGPGPA